MQRTALILLLALSACARIPTCNEARLYSGVGVECAAQAAICRGDVEAGAMPSRCWWQEFGDPQLDELMNTALVNSPTLSIAEERINAATQVAIQRRAKLYPEVDFALIDNWQRLSNQGFYRAFATNVPAVVNDVTTGLSFSFEFDLWGKNRMLFRAALREAESLVAERMQAELILTTSIAYSYAQLQLLLAERELLRSKYLNDKQITALHLRRLENAVDSALAPLAAHGVALSTESQLIALDQDLLILVHKLKALAGLCQDAPLCIDFHELQPLVSTLPCELSLHLVGARPDLIAQRALVEAAAQKIGAARTAFYPDVNLTSLIGFECIHWATLLRPGNFSATITPALTLPIFTAGRLRAQLNEQVALFNEAVYTYNGLIVRAAQEVADSLTSISHLQARLESLQAVLRTAEEQERIAKRRFEHALEGRADLIDAENAVLTRKLEVVFVEYGKQLAAIELVRALGGGLYGCP